jgi:hypothetical protein
MQNRRKTSAKTALYHFNSYTTLPIMPIWDSYEVFGVSEQRFGFKKTQRPLKGKKPLQILPPHFQINKILPPKSIFYTYTFFTS